MSGIQTDNRVAVEFKKAVKKDYLDFIEEMGATKDIKLASTGNYIAPKPLLEKQANLLINLIRHPENAPTNAEFPSQELEKHLFDAAFKLRTADGGTALHEAVDVAFARQGLLTSSEHFESVVKNSANVALKLASHGASEQLSIQNGNGETALLKSLLKIADSKLEGTPRKLKLGETRSPQTITQHDWGKTFTKAINVKAPNYKQLEVINKLIEKQTPEQLFIRDNHGNAAIDVAIYENFGLKPRSEAELGLSDRVGKIITSITKKANLEDLAPYTGAGIKSPSRSLITPIYEQRAGGKHATHAAKIQNDGNPTTLTFHR